MRYYGIWTHKSVNYRLAWDRTGDLSGFTKNVKPDQLTKVKIVVGTPAKGKTTDISASPLMPGGFYNPFETKGRLPLTGTDYVLPNKIKWFCQASQRGAPDAEGDPAWESTQSSIPRAYAAGKDHTQRFNVGVFGPSLPPGDLPNVVDRPGAVRVGDTFAAYMPLFSDGAGNLGTSAHTKARSSLHADGKEICALNDTLNGDSYTLPAGKRTYKLNVDVSRDPAQSAVSTRTTATWTFTSAHVPGDTPKQLPLTVVRYTSSLSTASTAKAGTTLSVPFALQGAATKAGTLRKLAFAVSYDDGRTWKQTTAMNTMECCGSLSLLSPLLRTSVSGSAVMQFRGRPTAERPGHRRRPRAIRSRRESHRRW
ncbi:hypothetical protein ACFXKG_06440 [Streptomyces sp. NPDC059255]|uniref:hypothetical protein n=1 Tax=Streptomyces sp. NPDC059255 TaxID=3346793 RepID=UPI00368E2115